MDIFSENYCRLCMRESSKRVRLATIDQDIEESFHELTQIKLSDHSFTMKLSNSICGKCAKELENCIDRRKMFIDIQKELEQKALIRVDIKNEVNLFEDTDIKIENESESRENDQFIDTFPETFMDYDSDDIKQDKEDTMAWTLHEPITSKKDHVEKNEENKNSSKKKNIGTQKCTECGSVVKNLVEHLKYTHNRVDKNYFCDHCEFASFFRQKMEIHQQKHIPKEFRIQIQCSECDFTCGRKDTLKKHKISMHQADRKRDFMCPQCDKTYFTKSQVNNHIRAVHQNIRRYVCQHCEKRFFTAKDLNLHVPRHFDKKEKCPQCDSLFYTQPEVLGHIKRVHLPPTETCEYPGCDKKFPTKDKLKIHFKVVHEKLKDFVCVECGASFGQYNTMKRHVDTVHRTFRVQCPVDNCTFSMKRKDKFKRHLINYHKHLDEQGRQDVMKSLKYHTDSEKEHIKEFPCVECGKIFTKYCNLKKHIEKGHEKKLYPPKLYLCPLDNCSYSVRGKYRLRKHLVKTHSTNEETLESILKNIKYES